MIDRPLDTPIDRPLDTPLDGSDDAVVERGPGAGDARAQAKRAAPLERVVLTKAQAAARRRRSIALALALGALAILFFVITLDKFGANLVGPNAIRDL